MKPKIKLLSIFLVFLALSGYGLQDTLKIQQEGLSQDSVDTGIETETMMEMETMTTELMDDYINKIIPPSPRAATFHIFGDVPVSYNTGMPDISIPLYTIESGGVKMPVVLRYHTALLKPPMNLCNVAFGWVLEVGGRVSRTIRNGPDVDWIRSEIRDDNTIDQRNLNDFTYLDDIYNNVRDAEYDFFSYTFGGNNGQFIIDEEDGQYEAIQFSHEPLKINLHTAETGYGAPYSGQELDKITIRDDLGNQFRFGGSHNTKEIEGNFNATTSWLLHKIVSPEGRELIEFEYDSLQGYNTSNNFNDYIGLENDAAEEIKGSYCELVGIDFSFDFYNEGYSRSYTMRTIKKISFIGGEIIFNLSTNRRHILSIEIKNESGIFKKIQFEKGEFNSSGYQQYNKLEKIKVNDDTGTNTVQEYSFDYNSPDLTFSNYSIDYWGYFNGHITSCYNLSPQRQFTLIGNYCPNPQQYSFTEGCANRESNLTYAKAYCLKKLFYPTGGETEFEFELNEYDHYRNPYSEYPVVSHNGGGLRIKTIINRTGDGHETKRSYEYEPGFIPRSFYYQKNYTTNSYNYIEVVLDDFYFQVNRYRSRILHSDLRPDLERGEVKYEKVTEYIGEQTNSSGKISYSYLYPDYSLTGLWLLPNSDCDYTFEYFKREDNPGVTGLLSEKQIFKKGISGYDTVSVLKYNYNRSFADYTNLKVFNLASYDGSTGLAGYSTREDLLNEFPPADITKTYPIYGLYNYDVRVGASKLTREEKTDYLEGGKVLTVTSYTYDNGYDHYATRVEQTINDTDKKIMEYKYPYDFPGIFPYSAMVDSNIIQPVIVRNEYKNSTWLSQEKTNYTDWGNNVYKPGSIEFSKMNDPQNLEVRFRFLDYDTHGNLLEAKKENDINTAFLWDATGTYVMAKVENAAYSQISSQNGKICTYNSITLYNSLKTLVPDALITTYTHKPLVGITQHTDPTGVTTYFQYDNFGRLEYVKNDDGKLLKRHGYHYAGQ